ncbi:transmembrane protein, putative (macronuclear) [Tetrahymena thermophila SB210]|uniref:Transmembrane protein, putative n=1 Tax=Tetrahymena thermophila (strain SB210) TaxID=312017 RepID=Q22T33_TETTS|nr:transmembrane protein, putative [Tetrahymena thermophila SB210]EAR88605.2 transmembrane protein, putative [Tetrahymena thermophila SB210]|eukprot:XP_001008850.2 transmembrane protein, putative [Tetrahymena thermophila SB210]
MAILNPPWINIDIFIDKTQSICYEISNWHLFYKLMQISTITFSLTLNLVSDLNNFSSMVFLLLGIILTFNYIKQISRHLSRKNITNFDRQELKQYYQLSFRNREGDVIENQLCYSWMQETKLLSNNLNQSQLIGSQIEYLFHTFFKPGTLEENQNMFKSNQSLFLCMENKMKLQYFSADRLFAFALFCIYKFIRFSNETSLSQLPDINKPDQVNAYFEKFQVFQNKIFGNQNIKEITLQSQIDFSKSIFIYKFFERILELPLVKIVIFFDHQKYLYNHSINRYRDFLQQFVTQIVFKRIDSEFNFNYKILLYDFYEDYFLQSKLNNQVKQSRI